MMKPLFLFPLFLMCAALFPIGSALADTPPLYDGRPDTREFMEQVKERIEEQMGTVYPDQEKKVKDFIKSLPKSEIDRGTDDTGKYHDMDKKIIQGVYDECLDLAPVFSANGMECCWCILKVAGQEVIVPTPEFEYWFPVEKTEAVDWPHKTGYMTTDEVRQQRDIIEDTFYPEPFKSWKEFEAKTWTGIAGLKIGEKAAELGYDGIETPDPNKIKLKDEDFNAARSLGDDANLRTPASGSRGITFSEFHTVPEEFGRNVLYWSNPLICHWNLVMGEKPEHKFPTAPGGDYLDPKFFYRSDGASDKEYPMTRNPTQENLSLIGRDEIRPELGYDHIGGFYNGGFIAKYLNRRILNPFECTENYIKESAGDDDIRGRTPSDMLLDLWKSRRDPDRESFAQSGCFRKNLGEWIPTRDRTQTKYHTQAAMIASMRGFKLAYYFFPPGGNCIGAGLPDSWGEKFCYPPTVPDKEGRLRTGVYYDFEPEPYTPAFGYHPLTPSDVFGAQHEHFAVNDTADGGTVGLGIPGQLASDKILWTKSDEMPKKCTTLMKYFNEIEKTEKDIANMPNKHEIPEDVRNVAVKWRLFRTCPKQELVTGVREMIPGTHSAVCCPRCPCDPSGRCCCPEQKKL